MKIISDPTFPQIQILSKSTKLQPQTTPLSLPKLVLLSAGAIIPLRKRFDGQQVLYYMQEQVKLVVAQSLQGEELEYFIFKNVKLGEGGFGVVKKAVSAKDKSRDLAVKIVPYDGDANKRKKIEKEINIIRLLPDHHNLVKVHPIKCFSENNFYIFMECCKDGTLVDLLKMPKTLDEERAFDVFWQLMNGYRVLWENGILHQDLKLANVLIKKGVLKITDFGFSIFTEKYIPSLTREGTLQYMSLQKLSSADYIADEKSDIYSLGVMMHELMTKLHPYVNQKGLNSKEYAGALRKAALVRPKLINSYSAPMQGLYDMVTRMVEKTAKDRVNCQEIYSYLDNDETFAKLRQRQAEKTMELIPNFMPMTVTEKTTVFAIPFGVEPEMEEQYIEKIKMDIDIKKNEEQLKIISKVEHWALSLRLIVYYFDRLARRLFIQKIRNKFYSDKNHSYNRTILACLLAQSKLTRWILKEIRYPQIFSKEELEIFRPSHQGIEVLKIVRRDEEYIREEITDNLKRTTQVQAKQIKKLMQLSEKQEFTEYVKMVIPFFQDCIAHKASLVSNKQDLITIVYLIDSIELLKPLPTALKSLDLQEYFHSIETKSKEKLFTEVQAYLTQNSIDSNFDEEIYTKDSFQQELQK